MALIDRIKERCEVAVSDAELQLMVDAELGEVLRRYGPSADPGSLVTQTFRSSYGDWTRASYWVFLDRPIGDTGTVAITEDGTALGSAEYTAELHSRKIGRLDSNGHHIPWSVFPVEVTYMPTHDGNQRQAVIVDLVMIELSYRGLVTSAKIGSQLSFTNRTDVEMARAGVLSRLGTSMGLL